MIMTCTTFSLLRVRFRRDGGAEEIRNISGSSTIRRTGVSVHDELEKTEKQLGQFHQTRILVFIMVTKRMAFDAISRNKISSGFN